MGMDLGQPTGGRQAGFPTSGGSHQLTKVSWISHLTACNQGVQGADSLPYSLGITSWYFANWLTVVNGSVSHWPLAKIAFWNLCFR